MANALPIHDADPHHALPRGTLLNDKFRLQRVIGVGGFGIVYLAHDEMSDVDVAIKEYMPTSLAGRTKTMQVSLISQSNAETFALGLKSFWNEARLLAKFRDEPLPLLKVYDAFHANGTAYMVMPVLRGRTAYQVRREMPKPPNERWLRTLLADLLPALERLHAENVYHRDIAPDNIQLDIRAKPVLMDLGAARHVISNRTQSITAILKPGYAPIEQYGESDELRQGPWTDIYALGATLHFLLLNKPPQPSTARLFDSGKPLIAQDIPGCSRAFLQVLDWMLAFRPEDRPQSVAQLRAALDASDPPGQLPAPKPVDSGGAGPRLVAAPAPITPATVPPAAPKAAAVALVPPVRAAAPSSGTPPTALPVDADATVIAQRKAVEAPALRPSRVPTRLMLAGLAGLVLACSAVAWLWPRQPAIAGTTSPVPAGADAPTKAAPLALPRPQAAPLAEPQDSPATGSNVQSNAPTISVAQPAAVATEPAPPPTASAAPPEPPLRAAAALTAKRSPLPAAAAPVVPVAGKKLPINDKDGALLPQPAEPFPVAAAPVPPPPPAPDPAPVVPVAAPAPPALASPSERCSQRDGFARTLCVSLVCGVPELHDHPQCVAIRRR